MGFIKKYLSLIIPTAVTLVAVVFLTVSLLMAQSLQEQLEESISTARRVSTYKGQKISSSQWKLERKYQEAHGRDANEISTAAKESSQRELLSYKIFPEPKETSAQIFKEFGQRYRQILEELLGSIGALDSPTDVELKSLLQRPAKGIERQGERPGFVIRDRGWTDRDDEGDLAIIEIIRKQRAETIPVYGNPTYLSGYKLWDEFIYAGRQDAVEKCWYSQLGLWIQKDIIDTIKQMNVGSSSVFTSPVKRILGVSFIGPVTDQPPAIDNMPRYVSSPTEGLTTPWTDRIGNEDIDVVHFSVSVVINSKDVLGFMQQLCCEKEHFFSGYFDKEQSHRMKHNQITVLKSEVRPIDRVKESDKGYYYGDDAVVQLDLVCEYVFNRAGYDAIKPQSIKRLLGQLKEDKKDEDKATGRRRTSRRRR